MNDGETLLVHLPTFDGPLDLLYYLIRKHELPIAEVSLASIADEYVNAVEGAQEVSLSVAGGYLVIAATLMYLKSKWLLPPEEEAVDPTQEEAVGPLLQQLADLQKLREVVHELSLREDRSRATFARPLTVELEERLDIMAEEEPFVEVSAFEILKAMRSMQEFTFPVARDIAREEIRLEDKILELLTMVRIRTRMNLSRLLKESRNLLEAVVFFLAALELAKQKTLKIAQREAFGEIEVTTAETGSS
ncbi:MAG: segregation/condensation protein A [Candidatus Coatesbacteria bacterium]